MPVPLSETFAVPIIEKSESPITPPAAAENRPEFTAAIIEVLFW